MTHRTERLTTTATRLYHWHHGTDYDPIPQHPTPTELAAAVALIDDLFGPRSNP